MGSEYPVDNLWRSFGRKLLMIGLFAQNIVFRILWATIYCVSCLTSPIDRRKFCPITGQLAVTEEGR